MEALELLDNAKCEDRVALFEFDAVHFLEVEQRGNKQQFVVAYQPRDEIDHEQLDIVLDRPR